MKIYKKLPGFKIIITCTALIIIRLFFINAECLAEGNKNPAVNIQEQIFQFQAVPEGKMITHDYIIENGGSALLRIEKVKTA